MAKVSFISLLFIVSLLIFPACKSTRDSCVTDSASIVDSLLRYKTTFSQGYRADQVENKKRIFRKLCNSLSDTSKFIIYDHRIRDIKAFYGLVYVYDNDKVYTYLQNNNNFDLVAGYKYDRNGKLGKYLSMIKDSALLKLERDAKIERNYPDANSLTVIYFDNKKKYYNVFIIK